MKIHPPPAMVRYVAAALAVVAVLFSTEALAADTAGDWRATYDLVMRWVNFLILVFVIVKFGKTPLKHFLQGQKEKVEVDIHRLEEEKQKAVEKVRETERMISESGERFEALKARIVARGERKKQRIIEDAKKESRVMITIAHHKIDNLMHLARDQFRAELVDAAVSLATARLTAEITAADNDLLLERYMESLQS